MTRIETFLITRRRELATDAPGGAVRLNRFINHDLSPRTIVYPIDSSSTLSYACARLLSYPSYYIFLRAPEVVACTPVTVPSRERKKEERERSRIDDIATKLLRILHRMDDSTTPIFYLALVMASLLMIDRYVIPPLLDRFKDRRDKSWLFPAGRWISQRSAMNSS